MKTFWEVILWIFVIIPLTCIACGVVKVLVEVLSPVLVPAILIIVVLLLVIGAIRRIFGY
jgi:hypothetical protein